MPELPEVETVVNNLSKKIVNLKFSEYHQIWKKVNYSNNSNLLNNELKQFKISNISRTGKYIIIDCNYKYIIFHLRMTGNLYYSKKKPNTKKHISCYFQFSDFSYLIFEDIRKFGGFYYMNSLDFLKQKLGIDALDTKLTTRYLYNITKTRKIKLKYFLLNQKFICGLGNIYIDEILWDCNLHPEIKTSNIKIKKITILINSIKKILTQSISYHGTTIINFKFDNMKTGNYKSKLKIYLRNNKKCFSCESIIVKKHICGRGTYYCPSCQKL